MNETLNVNLNNLTEEERNTLIALIERSEKKSESKVWKPEIGDKYFYVGVAGNIICTVWNNNGFDNNIYALNNCFRTEKESEFVKEKLKIIVELKRFAQEHNMESLDWNDSSQPKYYFYYSYLTKKIDIKLVYGIKTNNIYFTSVRTTEQAIKEIGEDRIKKYYFEVE